MTSRENKPIFVALEGGEGAGKSTQAQLLVARLQQEGRPALLVHEPGTTPLGQHLLALNQLSMVEGNRMDCAPAPCPCPGAWAWRPL